MYALFASHIPLDIGHYFKEKKDAFSYINNTEW